MAFGKELWRLAQNEIYRVTPIWSRGATAPVMTVGLYIKQLNSTGFTLASVGDCVKAWWDTEQNSSGLTEGVKGLYDDTVALESVKLRKWSPLSAVEEEYTTGLPIAGSQTSQSTPAQIAPLVSLRTAKIGRSYRGRVYLPPVAESVIDENFTLAVAGDLAAQTVGLIECFLAMSATLGAAQLVVWSKLLSTSDPVTVVKVDTFLRSQRRRATRPATYASEAV